MLAGEGGTGGDEEVSKPVLTVVRVQSATVDLEDVELRSAKTFDVQLSIR